MRRTLKLLSLLLTVCVMLTSMTSCFAGFRLLFTLGMMGEEVENDPILNTDWEESPLDYTMTDETLTEFEAQVDACLSLLLEGRNALKIQEAMIALEEAYYHIATQAQIAYILYCFDTTDETLSEQHLHASELSSDAYTLYNDMCKELDASDSPYRETFFSQWSEADLAEMRLYTDEVADLMSANDELLVTFRELGNTEMMTETPAMYLQLVANNNAIAEIFGYDNYYDYAYERIYYRDYGETERNALRSRMRDMKELIVNSYGSFESRAQAMSATAYNRLVQIMDSDYKEEYLNAYLDTLPTETQEEMRTLLTTGGSVFVDDENAYEGAFTAQLYDQNRPFCYFGPGYQSLFTVVHEMGHYYAGLYNEVDCYDLAELQSQGNEWLLVSRASELLGVSVAPALTDYLIYNQLVTAVIGTMIDEFEEQVYRNADTLKPEDLDGIMDGICAAYGGAEFISEYMTDISHYWRLVCMESPVYYISYATSGLTAVGLYFSALDDYDAAVGTYVTLATGLEYGVGFKSGIETAGVLSPFESELYNKLNALYKKN